MCPALYTPVCGSDGNMYGSKCQLDAEMCRKKEDIIVANDGPCIDCSKICTAKPAKAHKHPFGHGFGRVAQPAIKSLQYTYPVPLCGSDGKRYKNQCAVDKVNCERKKRKEKAISIISRPSYFGTCNKPNFLSNMPSYPLPHIIPHANPTPPQPHLMYQPPHIIPHVNPTPPQPYFMNQPMPQHNYGKPVMIPISQPHITKPTSQTVPQPNLTKPTPKPLPPPRPGKPKPQKKKKPKPQSGYWDPWSGKSKSQVWPTLFG